MAKLIPVSKHQVKKCDKCGTLIAFHTNRNGKKYPVEVFYHPSLGTCYRSGYGAYGNMTGWHKCQQRVAQQEIQKQQDAESIRQEKISAIAARFLPRMNAAMMAMDYEALQKANEEYTAALKDAGLS